MLQLTAVVVAVGVVAEQRIFGSSFTRGPLTPGALVA